MALVTNEQAARLGVGPFGDPDAPLTERLYSTFGNADVLAVRDDRLRVVVPEVGADAVAASVEVAGVALA